MGTDQKASLWFLSFCDPARPAGEQFLGACVVEAAGLDQAARAAWAAGCNPGGEVEITEVPDEHRSQFEKWSNRLLSKADVLSIDGEQGG